MSCSEGSSLRAGGWRLEKAMPSTVPLREAASTLIHPRNTQCSDCGEDIVIHHIQSYALSIYSLSSSVSSSHDTALLGGADM